MPRYPHSLIIIIIAAKLDLAMNVLIAFPIGYARHIYRDNHFGKIFHVVKAFGCLLGEVLVAFVNHKLMQCQLPAYIKQVKSEQH